MTTDDRSTTADDQGSDAPSSVVEPDLDQLERRLKVTFKDRALLRQALVHRSLTNELGESALASNERLEFLGDAVLGAAVAELIYLRFADRDEGHLTLLRSALVRTSTLARWAKKIDLATFVLVGRGEGRSGGRERQPLLASTFEAVIGAVYLDRGARTARRLVQRFAGEEIASWSERPVLDAKSRLQQISQARYGTRPAYQVVAVSGHGHRPVFTVQVIAGPGILATAQGPSKQAAQQMAAADALAILAADPGDEQLSSAAVDRQGGGLGAETSTLVPGVGGR